MKEEKFPYSRKLSHSGELRNLRGKHNEAKPRKFTTESVPNGNYQLTFSCLPAASCGWVHTCGLCCQSSGKDHVVACHENTLRGIMWHSTDRMGEIMGPPDNQRTIPAAL